MSDSQTQPQDDPSVPPPAGSPANLFGTPRVERTAFPKVAIVAALAAILLALGVIFVGGRSHRALPAGTILPLDSKAGTLPISDLLMSESTSLSGGKSTFIDGHIRNAGSQTVTAVTVQVLFRNDVGLPPQVETLPLSLIRTHEPYVDTQPVSAGPIAPGEIREFRLIFENINANWNVNLPEVRVTAVSTK